jgi:hypothetical protein
MRKINLIVLCIIALLFTSCATIFSGTSQPVSFESVPPGAEVVTIMKNGEQQTIGTTPCTVTISKKTKKVNFKKENFYDETYTMSGNLKLNGWYFVDLVGCFTLVGIPSTVVDMTNNSYFNLPKQIKVDLKKK